MLNGLRAPFTATALSPFGSSTRSVNAPTVSAFQDCAGSQMPISELCSGYFAQSSRSLILPADTTKSRGVAPWLSASDVSRSSVADQDEGRPLSRPSSVVTAILNTRARNGAAISGRATASMVLKPYFFSSPAFAPSLGRSFTDSRRCSTEIGLPDSKAPARSPQRARPAILVPWPC